MISKSFIYILNVSKNIYKKVSDIENENSSVAVDNTKNYKRTVKTKYQEVAQREYTNLESFYDNM